MAENTLRISKLNPVIFYETTRTNIDKYFTRYIEKYPFEERTYSWHDYEEQPRIWQVDEIIYLQFESMFDPISVRVVNKYRREVIALTPIVGLPNAFNPGYYMYETSISLATLTTGCYWIELICGSGASKKVLVSNMQFVSEDIIEDTVLIEYFHSQYYKNVIFETGIKFQVRLPGHFDLIDPVREDIVYRNQRYNKITLDSKSIEQQPLYFGDDMNGLSEEDLILLNHIWGCDNVSVDGKLFALVEPKIETIPIKRSRKRFAKVIVEPGLNRDSRIYTVTSDPNKKLFYAIHADIKLFGSTSNNGSSNTIPIIGVE